MANGEPHWFVTTSSLCQMVIVWIQYPLRILSRLTGMYLDSAKGVRKYGFGNSWLRQRRLKFKPLMWPDLFSLFIYVYHL